MFRITTPLLLAGILLLSACDGPPSVKSEAPPRLMPIVRVTQPNDEITLPFLLENRLQRPVKVVLLPDDPKLRTVAFLQWQLYKDGKALPFDVEIRPPFFDKRHVREIKSGEKLNVIINVSNLYLPKSLIPGEYELRIKYDLVPGSEAATYWEKKLGVTPMAIEQSIWLVVEPKK
jgi:hypothetical protein